MFRCLDLDQRSYADRTFCSWERGWRSLLLRRLTLHAEVEEAIIPPLAEQVIVLVTRGAALMESGGGDRWRSGNYLPGVVALTAPRRPVLLRWRPMSPDEPEATGEILQLHLPADTASRVVEELWDRDPAQVQLPDALATDDPVLEQTMLGLLEAAEAGVPDLYAEMAVEFIAVHTLVRHGALPPTGHVRGGDVRVRRAQRFLRENLHRPLSLAEIAAEAGMSRYHFLRAFRQQTGETPHRYLTRLRIDRGRHDLAHGSAPVGEIAVGCGFASQGYFATAFRRETGITPSAYRAFHQGPKR